MLLAPAPMTSVSSNAALPVIQAIYIGKSVDEDKKKNNEIYQDRIKQFYRMMKDLTFECHNPVLLHGLKQSEWH
jgi:hypothetical protein